METSLNHTADNIKNNITDTAVESKKMIQGLIESSNKRVNSALDSNKRITDSIREKFSNEGKEDTISGVVKNNFEKSVELAENALDSIINSYTKQMEWSADFNTKLVNAISNSQTPEKILNLVHENFEASRQLTINNTKEIIDFYNEHTNLAVNFNTKFGDIINAQMEAVFILNNNGLNTFTELTSQWWKQSETEVKI